MENGENVIPVWIVLPCVKVFPIKTYGHQDIYRNRKPGELYDAGTQTFMYEYQICEPENLHPNHKKTKLHFVNLDDMAEVDDKPVKIKSDRGCRYIRAQTEASHLLKEDTGCFSFEVDSEIDVTSEDFKSKKENAVISKKILSSEVEENTMEVRVLEVRTNGSKTNNVALHNEEPSTTSNVNRHIFMVDGVPCEMLLPLSLGQKKKFGNLSFDHEISKPVDNAKINEVPSSLKPSLGQKDAPLACEVATPVDNAKIKEGPSSSKPKPSLGQKDTPLACEVAKPVDNTKIVGASLPSMTPPFAYGQKNIRFGDHSLTCEVPKHVDYSKEEAMNDRGKVRGDWPKGRAKINKKAEKPFVLKGAEPRSGKKDT